jgi:hypothetical protein
MNDQNKLKAKQLAYHEVEWWKAHHRKDKVNLVEHMAKLYELQFGITYAQAKQAVEFRVEATKWHDIAEDLEDEGKQKESDEYWQKTEELLQKHFEILEAIVD